MVCAPRITFIGVTQEFRYGNGLSLISVTLNRENFEPGTGDGLLAELGYSRVPMPQYWRTTDRSILGTPFWIGPSFYPPEEFEWRLQGLTDEQWHGLTAMPRLQQVSRERILLRDTRYAIQEPGTRTRARIGADITGPIVYPGMIAYWGQFYIAITEIDPSLYRNSGQHRLTLRAMELDKVPLAQDIP